MGDQQPIEERPAFVAALTAFTVVMLAWGAFWLWYGVWGWAL